MLTNDNISVEVCKKLLRQATWRIQYKTRTQRLREGYPLFESYAYDCSFETAIISEMYVKELLALIPWDRCRYIIQKTVIEGMTEKEVALELKITQQGVSKWRRKGLAIIKQNICNSDKQ